MSLPGCTSFTFLITALDGSLMSKMTVWKKLETFGAVTTLCGTALALAKVYQIFHQRNVRKLQEREDRRTYDLVLNINGDPNRSDWELKSFKQQEPKEEVAVAVFGDFNVGKTYIINKLSGLNLPSGETDHTLGISIKSTRHGVMWIDTAGMGAPYCVRSQTPEERYGAEHLIGELAYRLSDAQLVVVSHCSLRDQEFINALHNWQIHENRPGKNLLMVVHNYCRISDPDLLMTAFVTDVVSRFCIEEITIPDRINPTSKRRVWVDKSHPYPIYHVLLGQEGSPAGERYNESTFSVIFTLCISRLGFGLGQNYLEGAVRDLNGDLLQKYFNSQTRLRVNDVGSKLVPDDGPYSYAGYTFHNDNGGSYPTKLSLSIPNYADPVKPPLSARSSVDVPVKPSNIGVEASRDPRAALRDVMRHIDPLDDDDPITRLEFRY